MLIDIILEKRLNYIKQFGFPPNEIWLHSDFIKHLKAELSRGPFKVTCNQVIKNKLPNAIDGMRIFENTDRPDIKVSFRNPHDKDRIWY